MKSDRLTRKTHLRRHAGQKDSITVYDLTAGESGHNNLISAVRHKPGLSHDAPQTFAFDKPSDILGWCGSMAVESPSAYSLWNHAALQGWSLGLADLKNNGFCLDYEHRQILLDHFSLAPEALGRSAYFRNTMLIALFRALRDVWHETGPASASLHYTPEDTLMIERVRAADNDTVAMLVCWELRGAGFADLWRHMIGSAEGDIALIFARHLEHDPSALFDGSALAYAFRQWYADEHRADSVDHETLEFLDVSVGAQDGRFGRSRLGSQAIEAMSELPGGICYLEGIGEIVRTDPFFAGLNDPINQTHLFHLVYDSQVVMVNNVPFRDRKLARLIFPDGEVEMI